MFHLLPEKEKKILQREYISRLILIGLIFVLASLLVGSVFLFPSYLLSVRKLADANMNNQQVKSAIAAKTDSALTTFLATLKDNLNALVPISKTTNFSILAREITDKKESGIKINEFSQSDQTLIINGVSSDRQSLLRFSHELQTIKDFSKVDLPISDFAKDKDINFSITLTVKANANQ
jgi:hypothetical protein